MMADNVLRSLLTGFVRLHILYHADKETICGVKMMEELKHHGYRIGPGTIYPILRDLERAGHLRCKEQIVAGKRRKNFRITPRGRRLLAQAREKLQELSSEIVEDRDARALRLAERPKE
jgi:PadR family transcriptional regulator, regulatory protein PadR